MHSHYISIQPDFRDTSLFAEMLRDRVQVNQKLLREASNVWIFEGSEDDCEAIQSEVDQIVKDSNGSLSEVECSIYQN